MARIRTIKEAYNDIKAMDPGTSITEWYIRQLILNGDIPSRRAGRKFLIDLDVLLSYFKGSNE